MSRIQAVIVLIAMMMISAGAGIFIGAAWCDRGKAEAINDQLESDAQAVTEIREVIKWREKEVIKYVDRIKTVEVASGCADEPVHPDIDNSLRESYRLASRRQAD